MDARTVSRTQGPPAKHDTAEALDRINSVYKDQNETL